MRAISLWQPYAQLIVEKMKKVETRGWSTNIRGQIAIHAAKRKPDDYFPALLGKSIPLGAIVGTAELIDCVPIELLYGSRYDTPAERQYGNWTPGRYGWVLDNIVMFDTAVSAKGRQGFWIWDESTAYPAL